MAAFKETFRLASLKLERLGKYREPVLFLGGGLLAGLLLFLSWFALQPAPDTESPSSPPTAAGTAAQNPLAADEGVLSGITGGPDLGQRSAAVGPGDAADDREAEVGADEASDASIAEPDAALEAATPVVISDEQAIANGLLDGPSQPGEAAPAPELKTYYVEVLRGTGVSELLEVKAESAGQARAIIRDYRDGPRIIRGPSLRPLH